MISPNAPGTKNRARIAPLATTRHLTSAEIARAINESRMIQTIEPKKIDHIIHRFDHSQPTPARETWKKKTRSPGIHVTHDSRNTTTAILPSTYSTRESGLQRYSGRALLARSREIKGGATITVRMNANAPCTSMNVRKNVLSIGSNSLTLICSSAIALAL